MLNPQSSVKIADLFSTPLSHVTKTSQPSALQLRRCVGSSLFTAERAASFA